MSQRSYFCLSCSSRVNIQAPRFNWTIMLLLTVSRLELHSFQIPTTLSDSQSITTLLLEVIISSKNESVCVCHWSDLTLRIILDAWWASMNVGSKCRFAWSNSWHAPPWRFYLHCGIKVTGSPGIICIVCRQVLCHPSEHGTSSIANHFLVKAQIAKIKESTESEVSELTGTTVDESALAIWKRQGSLGITNVSLQKKFIVDS